MLSSIFLIVLAALLALTIKQVRTLRRDVNTLFQERAREIEDRPTNLFNPEDAAEHAVDRHVTEYHRR